MWHLAYWLSMPYADGRYAVSRFNGMPNVVMPSVVAPRQARSLTSLQGILKGEVSLYHWPPVWLVWISLFCLQIKTKIVSCHTADSKLVKQEVNGTVILPPLVFPAHCQTHPKIIISDQRSSLPHGKVSDDGKKFYHVVADRNYDRGFSYICRDGTTRRWMCHGFMAVKDSVRSVYVCDLRRFVAENASDNSP